MPKTAHTIEDVRGAGYSVALSSGSVEVEEQALAASKERGAPERIATESQEIAAQTAVAIGIEAQAVVALGKMTHEEAAAYVREQSARAGERAFEMLTKARGEDQSFHERAVEIAKEMPDVWFVSALGDPETPDDDVQLYVACKQDGTGWDEGAQEMLDLLCSPPG